MANTDNFLAQFLTVSNGGTVPDDAPVEEAPRAPVKRSAAVAGPSEDERAAELAKLGRRGLSRYAYDLGGGRHRARFGLCE